MIPDIFYNHSIDSLLNGLPDAVIIGDANGIRRVNKGALRLMGLTLEQDIPEDLLTFISTFDFRFVDNNEPLVAGQGPLSKALKGERIVTELRHTNRETGKTVYSRCAAAPILEDGTVVGGLLILTDITERILAAQKLHETLHALSFSTQEQEAILNSIPDGVCIGSSKGIHKTNRSWLEMLGVTAAGALPAQPEQLHAKLNARSAATGEKLLPAQDPFSRALRGERVVQELIITNQKTGKDIYLRSAAAPVHLDGKIIGAITVNSDITKKVEAEHQLQNTLQELKRVNEELEAFTYAVSHDLKSPLGRISGLASLLLISNESQISDKDKYLLQLIVQSSEKLSELVNHLLKLGKIGQAELSYCSVDLTEICKQVVENLPPTKRKVSFTIAPDMHVWGDKTLMQSVMQNLLANAAKYSSKSPNAQVEVSAYEADGYTLCYVKDNGVGFDMAEADKLFMPFKRLYTGTNFEGTGVGLSTVKRIIERHQGKIWAEAKPGEGATFYFRLPTKTKRSGAGPNRSVKLHEDNPPSRANKLSA